MRIKAPNRVFRQKQVSVDPPYLGSGQDAGRSRSSGACRYRAIASTRSGKSGPKDQVALHYYYTSLSHWCTTHEVLKL